MLITPKLLRDIQSEILSGKLGVDRKEVTDEQESGFCAVVGKRKITLYAKPTRGKRVKLGELGETFDDQRTWVKTMRDRATSMRGQYKRKNSKGGTSAPGTPADLTVREYLDHFYYTDTAGEVGVKIREDKSQRAMRSCFDLLLDRKMGEMGMKDFREWRATYGQTIMSEDGHTVDVFGVKDTTKRRNFVAFNAIFNFAAEEGHIPKNPFKLKNGKGISFSEDGEEKGRPLTTDEVGRLREVLEARHIRDRTFCLLMLITGARPGELMKAQVQHIDFSQSRILLKAAFTKTKTTRYLHLSERTKDMLREYIEAERLPNPGPLFRNYAAGPHYNKPMTQFTKPWATICQRAMLNNRLYDLRHTFAKELYLKNKDVVTTSKLLGHTSIKTTQTYLSKMGVEMRESVSMLDDIVFGE